ncbi:MAG: 30S ribosomal protein S16 [Victivallales bacterium]|nr:30S ribosomal protein S16 [Victivallales bacterium]
MSVKIRLHRTGKLNQASHRIVVADARSPRDGRYIEIIGYYDPRHEDEKIDVAKAEEWISKGAQPSPTVSAILKRAKSGVGARKAPKKDVAPKAEAKAAKEEAPAAEPEQA